MNKGTFYERYKSLYFSLKNVIKKSEARVLNNDPDTLFLDNVNFFVKLYLISICTYLEAYLQDIAFEYANELDSRIKNANIPHNFIYWRITKEVKDKELKFHNADLSVTKKEISDNISANPYRTIMLFKYLGIDLSNNEEFEATRELVNSVVTKRNNIIHHNDKAMDISFSDLLAYIDVFLKYIKSIDYAIGKNK